MIRVETLVVACAVLAGCGSAPSPSDFAASDAPTHDTAVVIATGEDATAPSDPGAVAIEDSAEVSPVDTPAVDAAEVAPPDTSAVDAPSPIDAPPALDVAPLVDQDGDGLYDAAEAAAATSYFPFLSLDPKDGCSRMGVLYSVYPHPSDAKLLHIVWVLLYEKDCGSLGHAGDDEVFAATIDPSLPPPAGLRFLRAIAHQNTPCQAVTECGPCAKTPCTTTAWQGADWPVVFPSKDKHGNYLEKSACDGACFFANWCTLASAPAAPPFANAGEPGHPLVSDVTTQAFVNADHGWTDASLMHYDPWSQAKFGGAGAVGSDLTDPAFLTAVCPAKP